jgi:hypothetical protein
MVNFPEWIPTLAAIIFAVAATVFFVLSTRARRLVAATRDWVTGSATILEARVEARKGMTSDGGSATTHYPVVQYEYDVNGRTYYGARRVLGDEVSKGLRSWAERDIAAYQPGMRVPVYYNPSDPREAVLERSAPHGVYFNALATLFVLIALFMCAFNFGLREVLDNVFGAQ